MLRSENVYILFLIQSAHATALDPLKQMIALVTINVVMMMDLANVPQGILEMTAIPVIQDSIFPIQ